MSPAPASARGHADVAIIGAGVVGVATAYALARRGYHVHLLDRAAGPALGASFANGAQLSYAYTDAMAGPALWKQLPGLLTGRDPSFRARTSLDPDYLRWGLSFLRNATTARLHRNTLSTLELALESRAAMDALLDSHPIAFGQRTAGKLHVYYSADALPAARTMIALKRERGMRQRLVDPAEAMSIEPALAGASGMAGVVYSPDEEVGDPWAFSNGLLEVSRNQHGVDCSFGFDLKQLRRDGTSWRLEDAEGRTATARDVIVCAGIDSGRLLRPLGIRVPVMAVKGYSFTAPCGAAAPSASITDTARKLVFCRLGDRIRVAGLAEVNDWDPSPEPSRVQELVSLARASLPEAADYGRVTSHWAGLRPVTPFSTPIIGQVAPGLVLNIGHGMLGWTLAMGSAERVAALFPPR
ncbi:FAD-dependent oxidoreductase [Pseudoxanthomonas daejeonensis]|uniref:FAD-dependent oxidoreductase n=1 Tax=Pseudoxanthomonas daejeonensis TaxID=266062 RepID=UPI001F541BED|nr:FAD-dependent oxidoreductase [Pseudoxanthomonas daejeonensis]UNK56165.1 FAD-dependent oxidoreductase [Pseudoxanthomonas daejeonensis]